MQISVIGCGYLGAVHAASMAELGHDVVGIDVDEDKVALLNAGEAPFHEPGFTELLERNVKAGRLRFSTDFAAVAGARVHFIGVGTPQQAGSYAADMSQVNGAVANLLPHLAPTGDGPVLVVGKSTVPVGTAAQIADQVTAAGGVLVWNPEFLREGFAVQDTISPDRMVYGLPTDSEAARVGQEVLDEVYDNLINTQGIPRLLTDYATAELVKVAANSFLATKISFINAMAELCEATGADVTQLAAAIGHDDRIGHKFLRAGVGFGGGCLPKDIRAFMARAEELGVDEALGFLREVDSINDRRRDHVITLATDLLDGAVAGKKVAVLGASFKPDTDDMRNSPALDIAHRLSQAGAHVAVTDPQAGPILATQDNHGLSVADTPEDAITGADVVLLLTEWRQFRDLDPAAVKDLARRPAIIDGRNVLDPAQWRAAGWTYHGMGRP
ncbi:UDP-glucose/GDP-mannose dehydrogenase family protein [Georgenia satyanarayanai]|uniref:UDP-glucose dehydrogenase family protein n=1 Tax=Georgenia satyanarayanai TaxID=860221 RepID=UPI002041772A|nr:UDP-glucose/GDP-mannose dehydrogenase family protein [Georgenia satyanarayanai]MCM3661096.1 UDP-glucose/GDP-mannose dehydrogenase family protein [Georgenia satyanarayanai]